MSNNLFIISGPSGAGEDSVIEGAGKKLEIERVITTTTRSKRRGEKDGQPYYFVGKKDFQAKIQNNEFFEWTQHYNDNYYGVTREEIKRVQNSSKIGIWKIEYQGVEKAKKLIPGLKAILINAPLDQIEARLRGREKNISEDFIQERMDYTKEWLKRKDIYDYEVKNYDGLLNKAIEKVLKIIEKERQKKQKI